MPPKCSSLSLFSTDSFRSDTAELQLIRVFSISFTNAAYSQFFCPIFLQKLVETRELDMRQELIPFVGGFPRASNASIDNMGDHVFREGSHIGRQSLRRGR